MKNLFLLMILVGGLVSCSSKNKTIKDQDIKTRFEKSESSGSQEQIVVNDDEEVVVAKKTEMAEYIRQLSYLVKSKQDDLYGSKKRSSRGLYGKLERCVDKKGKNANMALPPKTEIVKEDEFGYLEHSKFGRDEQGSLVALEDTKLRDKIRDLEEKKNKLYEKEEELLLALRKCESAP